LISDIAPPSLLVFSVHPHEDIPKDYYITVISEKKQKIWILWALQRDETENLQPFAPGIPVIKKAVKKQSSFLHCLLS
jgi:hypothetical protein